ncbi:MAG: hypothetical protein J5950_06690 [Clostridia bacterium]|nr:hypothetical protein [Clostridia bacterium]
MKKSVALLLSLFIIFTAFVLPTKAEAYTAEDGAFLVAASTTLNAEIRLNIYVSLPESVLADETAYAVFTQSGETTTQYVKDIKASPETVFTQKVYRFTYDIAASDIYTKINFKLYGTVGGTANSVVPLYSATQDYTSAGFDYSVAEYLKDCASSENEKMVPLAKAMLDYGKAAAEYFNVEIAEDVDFSTEFAEFTRVPAMLKRYKFNSLNNNKPAGFENVGMQLLVGPTVSYMVYLKFADEAYIGYYTVKINGEEAELTEDYGNIFYLTIDDIKATALGDSIILTVERDDVVAKYELSGLSYAYEIATVEASTPEQTALNVNLGKALYLYYEAARTYFKDEYVSTYTGKTYNKVTLSYKGGIYRFLDNEMELEWIDHILDLIITDEMSTIDKILAVHNWMVLYIAYDYYNMNDPKNQELYSALDGSTVCAGYAYLFCAFMHELSIPCALITGLAGDDLENTENMENKEYHGWNAVQLDDGYWYFVDTTWDDPVMEINGTITSDFPNGENLRYDYFLVTFDVIKNDHKADEGTLPSPLGDDQYVHSDVINTIKHKIADSLWNDIQNGLIENACVLSCIDEINTYSHLLAEEMETAIGKGAQSYTCSFFMAKDVYEENGESSGIYNLVHEDFDHAAELWGGGHRYSVSYGIKSIVQGVFYEVFFTYTLVD